MCFVKVIVFCITSFLFSLSNELLLLCIIIKTILPFKLSSNYQATILSSSMSSSGKDRARAIVSHLIAQQIGLKAFYSELPDGLTTDVDIGSLVFDDASMWVRDPRTDPAARPNEFCTEFMRIIRDALGKKCKNVHLPVMNMSEDLFSSRHRIEH